MIDFYVKELEKYVGWTITSAARTPEATGDDFFGLTLISPDKKKKVILWILKDDEGNGHGSFNVDEIK